RRAVPLPRVPAPGDHRSPRADAGSDRPALPAPRPGLSVRAIRIDRFGGPEVMHLEDVPSPTPGPRELLVDVAFAGVNYRDVYEREGSYGGTPPLILGAEGAGTVAAAGPDVSEFAPGDRVAWAGAPGRYAEQVLLDADRARELAGGEGAAVVYDGVGQATFDESLAALRTRGSLVVYGAASGPPPALEPQRLMSGGSLYLTRPSLVHYTRTRGELLDRAR